MIHYTNTSQRNAWEEVMGRLANKAWKQESVIGRVRSGRSNSRSVPESSLLLLFAFKRSLWLQGERAEMKKGD